VLTCIIGRKAARDGSEKPQKNCVLRTLQLLQSSSIGKPYGVRARLRSGVFCCELKISGLSATIEFGMWPSLSYGLHLAQPWKTGNSKALLEQFGHFGRISAMHTK